MTETTRKLRDNFAEMAVYKDLQSTNSLSTLGLPSFTRDWLLQRFEDEEGQFDQQQLVDFVRKFIPKREGWLGIKSRIVKDYERVKMLAKIAVDIRVGSGQVAFTLPDFGLSASETIIEDDVWRECGGQLVNGREIWGMIELGYRPPDEDARPKVPGKIRLLSFRNFCPYETDLEAYKDIRKEFSTEEWIDLLLGAVDYNAAGYADEEEKLTMLTRLLPFAEKRLNLIELAPKGTGKSYLFGKVSRFGWLSNGGVMSRAKLFYDISRRQEGLVSGHDFITLDEVQTISFTDAEEMRGALKGYLEQGDFKVGNYAGVADAGMILCGNVDVDVMEKDGIANMFDELPDVFRESALIDRFHGFIKGWNIPRMNENLKVCGWALNSEYFCSILHEMRGDATYRAVVDECIVVPPKSDTRDTEAVKRIATAYLKLLFPNVRSPGDITERDFRRYCLRRATSMRATIKWQMGLIDREFAGKDVPLFTLRSEVFHA
jgi:ATP-dependent Lon protease